MKSSIDFRAPFSCSYNWMARRPINILIFILLILNESDLFEIYILRFQLVPLIRFLGPQRLSPDSPGKLGSVRFREIENCVILNSDLVGRALDSYPGALCPKPGTLDTFMGAHEHQKSGSNFFVWRLRSGEFLTSFLGPKNPFLVLCCNQ